LLFASCSFSALPDEQEASNIKKTACEGKSIKTIHLLGFVGVDMQI